MQFAVSRLPLELAAWNSELLFYPHAAALVSRLFVQAQIRITIHAIIVHPRKKLVTRIAVRFLCLQWYASNDGSQ